MLKPGDTLGHYTIDAIIGQGGMGRVYCAHDGRLGRRLAIKVLPSDGPAGAVANARLLREARAAAALDHPNVIAIYDVGEHEGAPYIAMELVSGNTLRGAVGDPAVPLATRLGWLATVARALSAAHRRGLVHRDIKPENVMVREDGLVKVLDFGIARRSSHDVDPTGSTQAPTLATLTKASFPAGTPLYMAPEQIRGDDLDGRADQFAWGVLAYELLTGKSPWRGGHDALAVVASVLTDEVDAAALDAAGAPAEVKAAVLRALRKRPDERFASMDDALAALDPAAARGAAVPSMPPAASAALPAASAAPPAASAAQAGPGLTTTTGQRYSTQEVRAILSRAVERQEQQSRDQGRLGFDDLLVAAREVGIDAETLREASRDLRSLARDDKEERDAWFRRKRRAFYRHLGVYILVNLAFVVLGAMTGTPEVLIPGLFWAVALGIHGLHVFTTHEDDWYEHREQKRRRDQKRRKRDETVSLVVDEGVDLLLQTGAAIRRHVEPLPAPAKVRIAGNKARRSAAEIEAAAAAEAEAAVAEAEAAAAEAEAAAEAAAAAAEAEARRR